MPLYIFVRFEPRPEKRVQLLDELRLILDPTRAQAGRVHINLYESTRDLCSFFIPSEWTDEAAFEAHAGLPHMTRFLSRLDELIAHPLQAVRTRQIG